MNPSFEGIVREVCNAQAEEVGFLNKPDEARHEVNLWAERKTRGLIKEVLPLLSVKRDPALILANALYFKGAWNQKLDVSKTRFRDFHLLNGKIVQVPSMTGVGGAASWVPNLWLRPKLRRES
ncbi:hypothetical protein H0E87_028047 [Populus deltoides]|uniref:Serpin domain-containing protein n=1 Tax=Populus deltoides TaxID=3696 RepID=A0A8T2WQB1_POPDE|nr:hypothetical protein H0E87_028047 [Populus deltoides]